MKRIISMLLAMVLIFNMAPPVYAAEMTDNDYIEIISDTAVLREGPGQKYDTVVTLEKGDCLMTSGRKTSKAGNVFFICDYAGETCYLFEKHAVTHNHYFDIITEGVAVCKCGEYVLDTNADTIQIDSVAATAGTLLGTEAVLAAQKLAALGGSIASGLSAAFPYIAVVTVGGMLLWMGVSTAGTQVRDVRRIECLDDVKKLMDMADDLETYFAAALVPGNVPALLIVSESMNLNEATNYLGKIVSNPLNALQASVTGESMINIWTFTDTTAERLCDKFVKKYRNYSYGNSQQVLGASEHDHTYRPYKIYFDHYHIFENKGPFSLTKVRNIHILFGRPLDKSEVI